MAGKQRKFKAEVQQILDLVIHSLYTHPDIFLRELISNAADAIDRARFEALSDSSILEDNPEWKIRIRADKEKRLLTVSDNGIGMSAEEIEENLGVIARSGTRRFLEELEKNGGKVTPELIGQFGVGFYSAFMVADRVTVLTRRAGLAADQAVRWESSGNGTYRIEPAERNERGTDIILHLKEEHAEYLEEWKIRKIVKTYSDFVEHPIVWVAEKDGKPEESVLNSRKPLWVRKKDEVKPEEYNEFYRHISHDFADPLAVIHWHVEGTTEFYALLYIPEHTAFEMFLPENRSGRVHLYVRKVFITDNAEMLTPPWLRFVYGVVESADLPLNVSRETLQENRLIRVIRNNLVKKVVDELGRMFREEREKYEKFWREFGRFIKEGIHGDPEVREKLKDLLLFESMNAGEGKLISLREYLDALPEGVEDIFYLTGESRTAVERSPYLERFRQLGLDVLLLTDPIDAFLMQQSLASYDDHGFKDIARADVAPPKLGEAAEKEAGESGAGGGETKDLTALVAALGKALGDRVREIKVSNRLTDSACCLVTAEHDPGVQMEKILQAVHKDMPATRRILEINPDHPLIQRMERLAAANPDHAKIREYAELLLDQAKLTAGQNIEDPLEFARRVSRLMAFEAENLAPGAGDENERAES